MKILILGGTRFLGKAVAEGLLADGHLLTVLSRHPENCPQGASIVGANRDAGVGQLSGKYFDVVFDFIAYDGLSPKQIFESLEFGAYIMISSAWVARVSKDIKADAPVLEIDETRMSSFYEVTRRYLTGKIAAESAVLERYDQKKDAAVLRLPIVWGKGDHTRRLAFYLERIIDGSPIISVGGGLNFTRILCKDDIAGCLCRAFSFLTQRPIWEALPHNMITVKDVIKLIASGIDKNVVLRNIPIEQLRNEFEEYLRFEPLWQEEPLAVTEGNLFCKMNAVLTPYPKWLVGASRQEKIVEKSSLREKEIAFLKKTDAG